MTRIHHEVHGEGREILVCNGLSQSTANWRGLARQNPRFRWILFDARGHGKSSVGETPYSLAGHVSDLLEVYEKAASQKPLLVGFSHGGRVALHAAAHHPGRFSGLVLVSVGSVVNARRRAYTESWYNCLKLGGVRALAWSSMPSIVGRKILERYSDYELLVKGSVSRNQEEGLLATFAGMSEYPPPREDAVRVDLPALIMRGGEDPLVLDEDVDHFLEWIPDARKSVFLDCGHTLALEEPERFTSAITSFLDGIA